MKKHSLRIPINLKCKDCIYDDLNTGTWRQQVAQCTNYDCPLFEVRPKSSTISSEIVPKRHYYHAINDSVGVRCE